MSERSDTGRSWGKERGKEELTLKTKVQHCVHKELPGPRAVLTKGAPLWTASSTDASLQTVRPDRGRKEETTTLRWKVEAKPFSSKSPNTVCDMEK